MRTITVSTFISLDGVFEAPEEWSLAYQSPDTMESALGLLRESDGLLLGRRTYEGFAEAWPEREDPMGFADKMNSMEKFVVSSTLADPTWNNTTVIADDVASRVQALKETDGGGLLLYGSGALTRSLLADGLIDELRLFVAPTVVGRGARLFVDDAPASFVPQETTQLSGGFILMRLAPEGVPAVA